MKNENLRPCLKNTPFWVSAIVSGNLVLMIVIIGLPIHVIIGVFYGLCEGIRSWKSEFSELLSK